MAHKGGGMAHAKTEDFLRSNVIIARLANYRLMTLQV